MLKPEIQPEQLEALRPIVEPLFARLRIEAGKLPPQADSALVYVFAEQPREQSR